MIIHHLRNKLTIFIIFGFIVCFVTILLIILRPKSYSVLLIVCDALRKDALSLYGGNNITPNLDKLGEMGTVFNHAYSTSNHTIPSTIGLFAARPPSLFKMGSTYKVPVEYVMPIEELQNKDYYTAAFLGHWALKNEELGISKYFNYVCSINHKSPIIEINKKQYQLTDFVSMFPRNISNKIEKIENNISHKPPDTTAFITSQVISYINDSWKKKNFLWIHFMDPHDPWAPPNVRRTHSKYGSIVDFDGMFYQNPALSDLYKKIIENHIELSDDDKAFFKYLYLAEVRYVDDCIGIIINQLKINKLLNKTIIVVTADHGEEFWEHGGFSHGQDYYDVQVNIPLIIVHPKYKSGGKIDFPISQVDIMPTLLEWLGIKSERLYGGHNISGIFEKEKNEMFPIFIEDGFYNSNSIAIIYKGKYKCLYNIKNEKVDIIENDSYGSYIYPNKIILSEIKIILKRYIKNNASEFQNRKPYSKEYIDKMKNIMKSLGYIR